MEESGVHLSDQTTAVLGQNVWKSYGRGTSKVFVLKNLNIRVPKRTIYGLLGPSGCGKTTLLRCILGRLEVTSGEITVLGKPPNTPDHGVPGNQVGYMPQECALFGEFSMRDHMMYFGKLHGMDKEKIKERTEFLVELLGLPNPDRLARELSGGQQRRVSFAIALLQEPPLLILDEPTVGVDPLLRASIWKHLRAVVSEMKTSIIITTHYIEEARQADTVGMMRDGHILAEAAPDQLMTKHCSSTLEEVFLKLCRDVTVSGSKYGAAFAENSGERLLEVPQANSEKTPLLGKKVSDDTRRKGVLGKMANALKGINILSNGKWFIVKMTVQILCLCLCVCYLSDAQVTVVWMYMPSAVKIGCIP
jgi:ABC-type multidrug transport system ATPase subunit